MCKIIVTSKMFCNLNLSKIKRKLHEKKSQTTFTLPAKKIIFDLFTSSYVTYINYLISTIRFNPFHFFKLSNVCVNIPVLVFPAKQIQNQKVACFNKTKLYSSFVNDFFCC